MKASAINKTYVEVVQLLLNQKYQSSYGENMVAATYNGRIKFVFPTTHHGVNEVEVGTWRFDKTGMRIVIMGDYDEMYQHVKNNTKPFAGKITSLNMQEITGYTPKETA